MVTINNNNNNDGGKNFLKYMYYIKCSKEWQEITQIYLFYLTDKKMHQLYPLQNYSPMRSFTPTFSKAALIAENTTEGFCEASTAVWMPRLL